MAVNPRTTGPPPRPRLTDDERLVIIQETLCGHLQKLDRILIGRMNLDIDRLNDPSMPPGWTTGDWIYLNFAWLDVRTDEHLVALWGLNYHELAHVIMTPRLRGKFREQMEGINMDVCINIMEDWRIETHFAAMFGSAERYLNLLCRILIMDDHQLRHRPPELEWTVFPLVMGRFYLDPAIRMRYELKFRDALKGYSRRREITEMNALHAGGAAPSGGTPFEEFNDHFQAVEDDYQIPGLKDQMLALLDLEGDVRVNKMLEITRRYCSLRWIGPDQDRNREMILLAKAMTVLMPWERLNENPVAGMPQPSNQTQGGILGPDIPTHTSMVDDRLQDNSAKAAAELVAQDEKESERLRDLAKKLDSDIKIRGFEKEEAEDEEEEAHGAEEEAPEATDEEPQAGEDGTEDEGEDEDEGDPDSGPTSGSSKPHHPEDGKIIIDPRQSVADSDEEKQSGYENPEDREVVHADGHLTGGAGTGEWSGRDQHHAQLSKQQLADLDKMFRDAGVMDQILSDEVREMMASKPVQRDLRNIRQALAEALGENLDLDTDLNNPYQTVPGDILAERNRLQRQLEELRGLLEGTWRDEQYAGKVNLRRWLNAPRSQRSTVFRAWIQDEIEEAGIELVVLLDRSSSMASAIDHASQICWMIGSAAQETEGRVHVISFADRNRDEVLLSPAKQLRWGQYQSFGTYGGTHAAGALGLALKVFQASHMPNRVLAIVTDGAWSDAGEAVEIIRRIRGMDVDTILMTVGLHMERTNRGCEHVAHCNDLNRASLELRNIIERIQLQVVRRVSQNRGFVND